jgi:hypothetical protein
LQQIKKGLKDYIRAKLVEFYSLVLIIIWWVCSRFKRYDSWLWYRFEYLVLLLYIYVCLYINNLFIFCFV